MSEYSKGDYTKCYEDICEIWYEDNLYCIVRTSDADKIIGVLNENEELKRSFSFKDNLIRDLKYSMNRLSDENEQLKQRNENQYNQLKQLWELIEKEDYNTLRSMLNQRETDEKLLQSEWRTYCD